MHALKEYASYLWYYERECDVKIWYSHCRRWSNWWYRSDEIGNSNISLISCLRQSSDSLNYYWTNTSAQRTLPCVPKQIGEETTTLFHMKRYTRMKQVRQFVYLLADRSSFLINHSHRISAGNITSFSFFRTQENSSAHRSIQHHRGARTTYPRISESPFVSTTSINEGNEVHNSLD